MTEKQQDRTWDREAWAGDLTDDRAPKSEHWNKTEFVGDQGEGAPLPQDPATMLEGETSISGNRQPSGEQHWAEPKADPIDQHPIDARPLAQPPIDRPPRV
jgi:hypothetical protein